MPSRRVFFALWPDGAQRTALAHATARTVRHSGGRPVPGANLHVTLTFLGAVSESRLEQLASLARRIAARFPRATPLVLSLAGFEHWAKPEILAVVERAEDVPAAPTAIAALAQILATETAACGFSPDLKLFRPHVTVARKVAWAPRSFEMRTVLWSFDAFALVESRTLAEGPVYSVVESFVLGSAEKVSA